MPDSAIEQLYAAIFDNDPLLLEAGSQKDYCEHLLNNILANRTITTTRPQHLLLNNPDSIRLFERPTRTVPPRPGEDAEREYWDAYLKRTGVSKTAFRELRHVTMVNDGTRTDKRVNGVFADHESAKAAVANFDNRIRIAAIGYRVRISRLVNDAMLDEDLCILNEVPEKSVDEGLRETAGVSQLGRTRALDTADMATWHEAITTKLAHAYHRKSHIVLLPEFALPVADSQAAVSIEEEIKDLCSAAKYDHFLFGGSRHEGGYNRGLVLQTIGQQCFGPSWHYKIASARTLGENILGPYHNKIASYPATFTLPDDESVDLAISIALCYDSFDPSTFLSLVNQSHKLGEETFPTVILVPSFNPSDAFVALLRDLSFLTRSVVVYVNGLHGNAKMFIGGFAVSDLAGITDDKTLRRLKELKKEVEKKLTETRKGFTAAAAQEGRDISRLRAVRKLQRQSAGLTELINALPGLKKSQAFEHLITVETCPGCGSHEDPAHCNRDVLYYNIDRELMATLLNFRAKYVDEDFLPQALQHPIPALP